jgi:enediyne biosynthesis protein E4
MKIIVKILACLLLVGCGDEKQFVLLSSGETNISFKNEIIETGLNNIMSYQYMYNGAGVAVADFNNDGWSDVFFVGNAVSNKLYLNEGSFNFTDVTEIAGVGGRETGWRTGVSVVDINADGLLDIYVCYSGNVKGEGMDAPIQRNRKERSNELFINQGPDKDGHPVFVESAKAVGLDAIGTFSSQAYFFDYDKDDDLDMLLVNHANMFYAPFFNTSKIRKSRHPYFGNQLYRNAGGKFENVSESAGIQGSGLNFGLSAAISDFNNDSWPDIYVTNDYDEQDFLYVNNHDGTFEETSHKSFAHMSKFSMGSDVADVNNDGLQDLFVVDMLPQDNKRQKLLKGPDTYDKYNLAVDSGFHRQNMRNMLHVQANSTRDSIPKFYEIAQMVGISNTDWSWAPLFADFNNDSFQDLYVTNGYLHDYTNMDFLKYSQDKIGRVINTSKERQEDILALIREMPSTPLVNYCFSGNGQSNFAQVNDAWGLSQKSISNGAAYGDLDNDGDLDLVVNNLNEVAFVYENNLGKKGNYIQIKLDGTKSNTLGIGSKIAVDLGGTTITRDMYLARGYQSSVDPVITIGIGGLSTIPKLVVTWSNGMESKLSNVAANQIITIKQSDAVKSAAAVKKSDITTIFEDVTKESHLDFIHRENRFSDFNVQRLLPYQSSKLGGKAAIGDVNNDGLDDIYFGGASGQPGSIYQAQKDGTFKAIQVAAFTEDAKYEDTGSTFFDADKDGDLDLYVVSGGFEFPPGDIRYKDRLYVNDGTGRFTRYDDALPEQIRSPGSEVAPADFDRDGDLDLFIAGRTEAQQFPIPSRSQLLLNESIGDKIRFRDVTLDIARPLARRGVITDAVWADVNNDGWQDLVLVGEWMPICVFRNVEGKSFIEDTSSFGLSETYGWWSSILADDLDGDGDIDFVAGNAGTNLQYSASPAKPLELFVQDVNEDGITDPIMSYYIGEKRYPNHTYDEMVDQIRSFRKKFPNYESYGNAETKDIVDIRKLDPGAYYKINYLQSSWLENKDGKMIIRPLPGFIQRSMVTGLLRHDFANLGRPQILCVGNFFPYRVEWGPSDSFSGGLIELRGGEWINVSNSPLALDGDIRDAHILTSINNGKMILISRNNAPASLFALRGRGK